MVMRRPAQTGKQKKVPSGNAQALRPDRWLGQRQRPDPAAPGYAHSADNAAQAIGSAPAPVRQASKRPQWSARAPCWGGQRSSGPPPWPRNGQAASADSASASASSPGRKSGGEPADRQRALLHHGQAAREPGRWDYRTRWARPAQSDHSVPSRWQAAAGWASAFAKR